MHKQEVLAQKAYLFAQAGSPRLLPLERARRLPVTHTAWGYYEDEVPDQKAPPPPAAANCTRDAHTIPTRRTVWLPVPYHSASGYRERHFVFVCTILKAAVLFSVEQYLPIL